MKEITIKDKTYQLKLNTRAIVNIEKRLGTNPLNIFMEAAENKIPSIASLMIMFHGMLEPFNHGIKLEDTYDLYDEYCDEGHTIVDFINVLVEVFKEAGFIPEDNNEKN